MAPKLELNYFDARGRVLPHRLALYVSGVDFKDVRHAPTDTEWKKCAPLGQMPFLMIDGECLCQSSAILLYISSITNLGFEDGLLSARTAEVVGIVDDIASKFFAAYAVTDEEEKKKQRIQLCTEVMPGLLTKFESLLAKLTKNGYAVGGKLSIADLVIFSLVDFVKCGFLDHVDKNLTDPYATISSIHKKVGEMPKVKEWIDKNEKKA